MASREERVLGIIPNPRPVSLSVFSAISPSHQSLMAALRPQVLFPLFAKVTTLPGIGPRLVKLVEKVAGENVADLLWHLPSGIVDRRFAPKVGDAPPGRIATLIVEVLAHSPPPPRRRRRPARPRGRGCAVRRAARLSGDSWAIQAPARQQGRWPRAARAGARTQPARSRPNSSSRRRRSSNRRLSARREPHASKAAGIPSSEGAVAGAI